MKRPDRPEPVTADTITDEQIRELLSADDPPLAESTVDTCHLALWRDGDPKTWRPRTIRLHAQDRSGDRFLPRDFTASVYVDPSGKLVDNR